MTMTAPTSGSPTLEALFKNCVTEEQVQSASNQVRGPYHVGEVTAFVFRPTKESKNNRGMQVVQLNDTGLAHGTEGGSMEVDLNQMDENEMKDRAQSWFSKAVRHGEMSLRDTVAVVFDGSRTYSSALDANNVETFKATLETLSRPTWTERATTAVKKALGCQP